LLGERRYRRKRRMSDQYEEFHRVEELEEGKQSTLSETGEKRRQPKVLEGLKKAGETVIELIGEDVSREGLKKTPERFAQAMLYFTSGYDVKPLDVVNNAVFEVEADDMVIVRDIEIFSLCEHHLVPFFGKGRRASFSSSSSLSSSFS
jgi:GTP cyclohydrolase I